MNTKRIATTITILLASPLLVGWMLAGCQSSSSQIAATPFDRPIPIYRGPAGPPGLQGPQGPRGPKGPAGHIGVIPIWVTYREFLFNPDSDTLTDPQLDEVAAMEDYMNRTPSLLLGIDGYTDELATNQDVARVEAMRAAFLQAGMPAGRIVTGPLGHPNLRQKNHIEVLLKSAP